MRPRGAVIVSIAAGILLGSTTPVAGDTAETIGTSRGGTAITAQYQGPQHPRAVLVVLGSMHGRERAGEPIVERLRSLGPPAQIGWWLIRTMNPDGDRRENLRGVDLNRNFPNAWIPQGPRGGPKWSGPRPASEPETRAVIAFLERVRPDALLSFHQPFGVVDLSHVRARPAAREFASDLGLPARVVRCSGPCHGTLTGFADSLGAIAITIELPGRVTPAFEARAARAVVRFGERLGR